MGYPSQITPNSKSKTPASTMISYTKLEGKGYSFEGATKKEFS